MLRSRVFRELRSLLRGKEETLKLKCLSFCLASSMVVAVSGCSTPELTQGGRVAGTFEFDAVDETRLVTLSGNVNLMARVQFDVGPVSAELPMERMLLLLKSSPQRQAELDALVEAQQNPTSPLYHQWLTPAEFGARFGASADDVARVTAWLVRHGFAITGIPAGNRLVIFSGTAGQVLDSFHTEMRRYAVEGATHVANAQDPQIPEALSGAVGGVVSLNDFRHASQIASRMPIDVQPGPHALYSAGNTHYLFPADLAAIYNLNPLYTAGTSGAGVSIAIAGRSNINLSDVAAFRSLAGLAANPPSVILSGANPGLVSGDQDESTLDVEWAGAAAPAAGITLVTAASTATTDGVDLAAAYIVNHATAQVVSVSYGQCEQQMGAAELAFYNSLWQQAASEGMSVFVASGDSGAAGCSAPSAAKGAGTGVNGLCSSPYATCVGGTEFNEGANPAQYWAAANSAGYESALGYIPETVWNESGANGGTGLWASGGGASRVYAQPAWQAQVVGSSAANGMRAVPDVALSAAIHDGYMINENGSNWIISGTSAAAPAFAGMMALVVESSRGTGQGSANAKLYALANTAPETFHSTPEGNNSVPGVVGFQANGATYNLATGLGSVDGAALVRNWSARTEAAPTLALNGATAPIVVAQGGEATASFTVTTGGSFSGSVNLSVSGVAPGLTAAWAANPIVADTNGSKATLTLTASALAALGDSSFTVTAAGDGVSASQAVSVQVKPPRVCNGSLPVPCGTPMPVR